MSLPSWTLAPLVRNRKQTLASLARGASKNAVFVTLWILGTATVALALTLMGEDNGPLPDYSAALAQGERQPDEDVRGFLGEADLGEAEADLASSLMSENNEPLPDDATHPVQTGGQEQADQYSGMPPPSVEPTLFATLPTLSYEEAAGDEVAGSAEPTLPAIPPALSTEEAADTPTGTVDPSSTTAGGDGTEGSPSASQGLDDSCPYGG